MSFKPQIYCDKREKDEERKEKNTFEYLKVKSKRDCKKKREREKNERILFQSILKGELKKARTNIQNKQENVERNRRE